MVQLSAVSRAEAPNRNRCQSGGLLRWLALGANLRLRYNFGEGSDLWLVYDEGFNTDREPEVGMPRLPWSDIRVVRLKLTHTFVPW